MKVALVQMPIVWEDKAANFAMVQEMLADVSFPDGNGLIVLPELFATGFTMDSKTHAEDEMAETEQYLVELAQQKSAHVIGGLALKQKQGLPVNCAVIVSPDEGVVCRYQKTHPFSYGEENEHYSPGSRIHTVDVNGIKVSPAVCYDLRFPEQFRLAVDSGAELFVVIANWPEKRNQHWRTLLQARAIENQACVIGVNRCGDDPNLSYAGSTILVDQLGEIVADAGTEAGVIEADLSLIDLREWRKNFPALRDRHDSLST